MTTYLIVGLDRPEIKVHAFESAEAASPLERAAAEEGTPAWVVSSAADLVGRPGPILVRLYNAIAPEGVAPVKKFETRTAGADRLFALLEKHHGPKGAAAAAAPAEAKPAAECAPSTAEEEEVKKQKGKKKVRAKAANGNGGARALVREDSSRGKLLKLAVENPGIAAKSLATRAGVSGEGSMDAVGRVRLRLRKVADAIEGSTVDFGEPSGAHVTFKLPKGTTLDKVFGRS